MTIRFPEFMTARSAGTRRGATFTRAAARMASCVAAVLALAGSASQTLARTDPDEPGDTVVQQFVVRLLPGTDVREITGGHGHDAVILASVPSRNLYLAQTLPGEEITFEQELEGNELVSGHEHNQLNGVTGGNGRGFFVSIADPARVDTQSGTSVIGLAMAQLTMRGAGVIIAVLDTGVANHPRLAGRLLPGYNWVDQNTDTADTGNGIDDDNDGIIDEYVGHGTAVAGIINTVAPDAMILPVKVLTDDGLGSTFSAAAGIYYAIDHGASVINLSLSSPILSLAVQDAIQEAQALGIVVVASVGNNGSAELNFPASLPGVLGVAATDNFDRKLPFSDFGTDVTLCAPGNNVITLSPDGTARAVSGTSYSTAFVSGAAALVRGRMPLLSGDGVRLMLTSTAYSIDWRNRAYMGQLGAGRLSLSDLSRAINAPKIRPIGMLQK